MAQNLSQYLKENPSKGFKPVPHYFASGDYLSWFLRGDECRAKRIDDVLTVFLAEGTDELVGCKVKGVKHILETAGTFGIVVDDDDIRIGLLFLPGALCAQDAEQKR